MPRQTSPAAVVSPILFPTAEQDKKIRNCALPADAPELLPRSLASMAIIPLQIEMVYGIGKAHGVVLDQGHIQGIHRRRGVGLTAHSVERFGHSLLGPAIQLQAQYLPQIQQHAATLDAGQVAALVRV